MMSSRRRSTKPHLSICLAAVFAVMAIVGLTASGASAASWKLHGSEPTGPLTITSQIGAGPTVQIQCNAPNMEGSIGSGGKGTSVVSFGSCVDLTEPGCTVAPLQLQANSELISVGGKTYDKFTPVAPSGFASIVLSGSTCLQGGWEAPLTGSFAGAGIESSAPGQPTVTFSEAINLTVGAALKLGKKPATLTGTTSELVNGGSPTEWRTLATPELVSLSGGPLTMSFEYGSQVLISCAKVSSEGARLTGTQTEEITGVKLSECSVSRAKCTLPGNSFSFEHVVGSLQQVAGKTYEVFTPASRYLWFEGGECSLSGVMWPVSGSFAGVGFKSPQLVQQLEFTAASSAATGAYLKVGAKSAQVAGSFGQTLSGSQSGLWWGVS
jgi:hypothetical protein